VEHLAKAYGDGAWSLHTKAFTAKGVVQKKKVAFVLPNNFMNNSGAALKPLVTSVKAASALVVIYDDLDLPLGTIKMSYDRGSGGHRGIESIAKALKTSAFIRIRVGICPTTPGGKLKKPAGEELVLKHILSAFSPKEKEVLKKVIKKIAAALEVLVTNGRNRATGFLNTN